MHDPELTPDDMEDFKAYCTLSDEFDEFIKGKDLFSSQDLAVFFLLRGVELMIDHFEGEKSAAFQSISWHIKFMYAGDEDPEEESDE